MTMYWRGWRIFSLMISVIICSVVRGEVLFGIERLERGRRRRELLLRTRVLLAGIYCAPVTSETADYYSGDKDGFRAARAS